jgi:type IX secretion system substrate protein
MKLKLTIASLILSLFFIGIFNIDTSKSPKNLIKRHAYFLKHNPINRRLKMSKKERQNIGLPPNKYFEREYLLEMNPALGRPTPEKLFALQEQLNDKSITRRVPGDASDNSWVERGPNNIGGRTRALLYDPNDATHKRVFAGGVSGGLWVTNDITDANVSWTRVSGISENISVSAFTVDPNNTQNIYVATGETYTSGDVNGNGIWKSSDGGANWTHIFGGSTGTTVVQTLSGGGLQFLVPGQYHVNDIKAMDNAGSTILFAAVGANNFSFSGPNNTFLGAFEYGLYKSTNGGTTWSLIPNDISGHPYEVNDIEIGADNTVWIATKNSVFGAGGGAILASTNNGSTFTLKHTIASGRRTEIAVSSTNAGTIYVLGQVASNAPVTILKTLDAFATTPTVLSLPNDGDNGISATDFTRGQSFYDLMLEVSPTNDAIAYVGGIDIFRTTNSGTSWSQISKWSNNPGLSTLNIPLVHADQHALTFDPSNPNKAVIGNDGGVYYASSLSSASFSTTAIIDRNKDYNVTQFYKGAIGQGTSTDMLIAGAQDNGSLFSESTPPTSVSGFTDIFGGDGAYEFIDKDGAYLIVSYVYNTYTRMNLPLGTGSVVVYNDNDDTVTTTGTFINPADLDDSLDVLYADGTDGATNQIAKYSDITTATPVRTNMTNNKLIGQPTAFKVSPYSTTSTTLLVGTDEGKLLKIANANTGAPAWSDITDAGFVGSISAMDFGANENEIIVTFHNYGVTSIWFSTDGGTSWTSKEGDLPDLPIKAVMMNPLNNDEVIIGTDLGVWRTTNFKTASPAWVQSQNGMQNAKVTSFDLRTADNTVLASTYGRGLFTGTFTSAVLGVNNFDLAKSEIKVYPTVSDGNFNIASKQNFGQTKIQVYDLRGRQVYQSQITLNSIQEMKLGTQLKSGVYILKMQNEKINYSSKIIIK